MILRICNLQKKFHPEAIFVAGGIEAQFNYQNVLDKTPCKIVIISEGEKSLLALANGTEIDNIPGIVFKNSSVPLDQHTFDFATSAIEWEEGITLRKILGLLSEQIW